LDEKTLVKTFRKIYPRGNPKRFCKLLFNIIDTDKNRKIDFCEYIQAISLMNDTDIVKKLKLTFRIYDQNSDGMIDHCDIEYTICAILELNGIKERKGVNSPKERAQNLLKMFDTKLQIEEYEFVEKCLSDPKLIQLIQY
jgi:Ca2+-binding EF-hand superfamily protein